MSSTTINASAFDRRFTRVIAAVFCTIAVVVVVPTVLVAVALHRFGHASPLHGVDAPWRWSASAVQSWVHRLSAGLDSSATLIDIFIRVALVIGWLCFAVVLFTVLDDMVFQLRHGMPSARRHRLVGLGPLGRRLATLLIAVLPLAATATPTLAIGAANRPAVGHVVRTNSDLPAPASATVSVRIGDEPTA